MYIFIALFIFNNSMLVKGGGSLALGEKERVQELVAMTWSETDTFTCFSLPSFVVNTDTHTESQEAEKREARYQLVKDAHNNPDGFTSTFSQTLNNAQKHQNESAVPVALSEGGCQTSSFEIDDAMKAGVSTEDALMGVGEADADDPAGLSIGVRELVTDIVNVAKVSPGCLLDVQDLARPPGPTDNKDKPRRKRDPNASQAGGTSFVGGASIATGASGANAGFGREASQVAASGGGTQQLSGVADAGAGGGETAVPEADGNAILFQKRTNQILESRNLLKRLQMVERAVQQNAYHRKHLDYRDLPDIKPLSLLSEKDRNKDAGGAGGGLGFGAFGGGKVPTMGGVAASSTDSMDSTSVVEEEDDDAPVKPLKTLFSYVNHDLVQGRSVTAMVWNKVNQDILAVGYGKLDTFVDSSKPGDAVDEEANGGLVLFWSLRNPEYPEKVLRTSRPVTALEFSRLSPMLLAVGLDSGDVCVYNVKREGADWNVPLESSSGMSVGQGHTEAVWQVKWVPRGNERVESLVSISSDGRVLQWNIKKGISVSCLMRLARSGKNDAWISRQAAGLCFDFCQDDPSSYIVGTEEGTIHKCSVSYSEQYLETYTPHHGPVYKVKFSPRWPKVFLSCSNDWSMSLYHQELPSRPLFNMKATDDDFAVTDIAWCPDNSTVFASVSQNGKLQIWDLSVSCLDPVVNVDTTGDEITKTKKSKKKGTAEESEIDPETGLPIAQTSLLPPAPFGSIGEAKEEVKETRIQRLLRNLTESSNTNLVDEAPLHSTIGDNDKIASPKRRVLTCVQFSETAPAIVVGDSKGCVTVYRVIQPVVITQLGPKQQEEKLEAAVMTLDPAAADQLKSSEAKSTEA